MSTRDRKHGDDAARARLGLIVDADPAAQVAQSDEIDAASASLRAALASTELAPAELDGADHEALLALALGADVAEYAPHELHEAEALRLALEAGGAHPLAAWADGLRHAWIEPEPLAEQDNELLVALTLGIGAELHVETAAITEADAAELAAWSQALTLAWQAGDAALDAADNETLLALSGVTANVGTSDQEQLSAAQLQAALAGSGDHPLAAFATSVQRAFAPSALAELSHERLIKRALSAEAGQTAAVQPQDQRSAAPLPLRANRRAVSRNMVLAAIVAMAAAIALFAGSFEWLETRPGGTAKSPTSRGGDAGVALAVSRSTSDLFDPMTPFPRKGGESTRMQRIVASRSADLRANRFAAWGVR